MEYGPYKTEISDDGRWEKVVRRFPFFHHYRETATGGCNRVFWRSSSICVCCRSLVAQRSHTAERSQLHAVTGIRLVLHSNRTLKALNSNNHLKRKITTGWWWKTPTKFFWLSVHRNWPGIPILLRSFVFTVGLLARLRWGRKNERHHTFQRVNNSRKNEGKIGGKGIFLNEKQKIKKSKMLLVDGIEVLSAISLIYSRLCDSTRKANTWAYVSLSFSGFFLARWTWSERK